MFLVDSQIEKLEIPDQQYTFIADIPRKELQRICRQLSEFDFTIKLRGTLNELEFSAEGPVGKGRVALKQRLVSNLDMRVSLTLQDPITQSYSARWLVVFASARGLCRSVKLCSGPNVPLMFQYELRSLEDTYLECYLAPKIDD